MMPLLNLVLSFAAGATAMYWLDDAVRRRRAGGLLGSQVRLRAQVQAQIDRTVTHPDAIRVQIDGGLVRVSGQVLADEADRLLSRIIHLPGVHKVHNALSPVSDPARFEELRAAANASNLQP
jgi:hypothetical protein